MLSFTFHLYCISIPDKGESRHVARIDVVGIVGLSHMIFLIPADLNVNQAQCHLLADRVSIHTEQSFTADVGPGVSAST